MNTLQTNNLNTEESQQSMQELHSQRDFLSYSKQEGKSLSSIKKDDENMLQVKLVLDCDSIKYFGTTKGKSNMDQCFKKVRQIRVEASMEITKQSIITFTIAKSLKKHSFRAYYALITLSNNGSYENTLKVMFILSNNRQLKISMEKEYLKLFIKVLQHTEMKFYMNSMSKADEGEILHNTIKRFSSKRQCVFASLCSFNGQDCSVLLKEGQQFIVIKEYCQIKRFPISEFITEGLFWVQIDDYWLSFINRGQKLAFLFEMNSNYLARALTRAQPHKEISSEIVRQYSSETKNVERRFDSQNNRAVLKTQLKNVQKFSMIEQSTNVNNFSQPIQKLPTQMEDEHSVQISRKLSFERSIQKAATHKIEEQIICDDEEMNPINEIEKKQKVQAILIELQVQEEIEVQAQAGRVRAKQKIQKQAEEDKLQVQAVKEVQVEQEQENKIQAEEEEAFMQPEEGKIQAKQERREITLQSGAAEAKIDILPESIGQKQAIVTYEKISDQIKLQSEVNFQYKPKCQLLREKSIKKHHQIQDGKIQLSEKIWQKQQKIEKNGQRIQKRQIQLLEVLQISQRALLSLEQNDQLNYYHLNHSLQFEKHPTVLEYQHILLKPTKLFVSSNNFSVNFLDGNRRGVFNYDFNQETAIKILNDSEVLQEVKEIKRIDDNSNVIMSFDTITIIDTRMPQTQNQKMKKYKRQMFGFEKMDVLEQKVIVGSEDGKIKILDLRNLDKRSINNFDLRMDTMKKGLFYRRSNNQQMFSSLKILNTSDIFCSYDNSAYVIDSRSKNNQKSVFQNSLRYSSRNYIAKYPEDIEQKPVFLTHRSKERASFSINSGGSKLIIGSSSNIELLDLQLRKFTNIIISGLNDLCFIDFDKYSSADSLLCGFRSQGQIQFRCIPQ